MLESLQSPFTTDFILNSCFIVLAISVMIVLVIYMIFSTESLQLIILMSAFSILSSLVYALLDAPDVAMTEAALGAAFSTCVLLNILAQIHDESNKFSSNKVRNLLAILAVSSLLFLLSAVFVDFPSFGDSTSPLHRGVSMYYLDNTQADIGITSVVSAILASYRGYDTLGETTVILIAAFGVLLIMTRKKKNA